MTEDGISLPRMGAGSRQFSTNHMHDYVPLPWRTRRQEQTNTATAFRIQVVKDTLQVASDTFKENVQISRQLDDKAQKMGAFAGAFLAVAFGFIRPDGVGVVVAKAGPGARILLFGSLVLFLGCIGGCLAVMWVRRMPGPLAFDIVQSMAEDVMKTPLEELSATFQEQYYQTGTAIWSTILERQVGLNRSKGHRLFFAQILLGIGIIAVVQFLCLFTLTV